MKVILNRDELAIAVSEYLRRRGLTPTTAISFFDSGYFDCLEIDAGATFDIKVPEPHEEGPYR